MIIEVSVLTVTLYVEAKDILYGIIEKNSSKRGSILRFYCYFCHVCWVLYICLTSREQTENR